MIAAGAAVEVGESLFWIRWSRRRRALTGAEALVGVQGVVVVPCRPEGQIRIHGELWRARCPDGAGRDDLVTVVGVDGLTLLVDRLRSAQDEP